MEGSDVLEDISDKSQTISVLVMVIIHFHRIAD